MRLLLTTIVTIVAAAPIMAHAQSLTVTSPTSSCGIAEELCIEALDQDADGRLELSELNNFSSEGKRSTLIARDFIDEFDSNKDGVIEASELPKDLADELDPISSAPASSL
ncbi:EF-hand domain-containing protein [Loktanella sp. DJP18]|uniref:EF-hand domain-containing protein n=1 Tax=Loktanella sp. DJP18 TaxID=3409788 RepID=UPI003BB57179